MLKKLSVNIYLKGEGEGGREGYQKYPSRVWKWKANCKFANSVVGSFLSSESLDASYCKYWFKGAMKLMVHS